MEGSTCEVIWGGDDSGVSFKAIEGRSMGLLLLQNNKILRDNMKFVGNIL